MSDNDQGPWGGDGSKKGEGKENGKHIPEKQSGQNNGGSQMPPELDEIVRKGQEQLRVLMGGKAGKSGNGGNQGGSPNKYGKASDFFRINCISGFMAFYFFLPC